MALLAAAFSTAWVAVPAAQASAEYPYLAVTVSRSLHRSTVPGSGTYVGRAPTKMLAEGSLQSVPA
jgi:hypothetical protein